MRLYVLAICGACALVLALTAELPDLNSVALAFLFAGVAAVAQLRPIYLSQKLSGDQTGGRL